MTDILVIQGQAFEALFPLPPGVAVEDVSPAFEVPVTSGEDTVVEFIPDAGAMLSTRGDETILVLSAADTTQFPVGIFRYAVDLVSRAEEQPLLNVEGEFRVVPAPPSMPTTTGPVRPWDLFNPASPRASRELRRERMATCLECPDLHVGFCKNCGCRMRWKTTLLDATCPLGKWGAAAGFTQHAPVDLAIPDEGVVGL